MIKNTKKYIVIFASFLLLMSATYIGINLSDNSRLNDNEKEVVLEVVNQYYKSLENEEFYIALDLCDFEDSNFDFETRLILLNEIWGNIITDFELEYEAGNVDFYEEEKKYAVPISVTIKYDGTSGGSVKEIVFVEKVRDDWKISAIRGLDRYGGFRVADYQYDRLIHFLIPNEQEY